MPTMTDASTISPDILATNTVAEAHQVSEVRAIVNELQSKIDAIEIEIIDVKATVRRKSVRLRALRELRAKQRGIRKTKFLYEGLLSPMRTAPPEILSQIFFHCLPSLHTFICPMNAPLLLTRVCRRWRHVTLSTPRLWTSISIGADVKNRSYMDMIPLGWDPVLITNMWLENSGTLPLDITLCIPEWLPDSSRGKRTRARARDINQDVMENLKANVHRWRSFRATLSVPTLHVSFPSGVLIRAPLMESFVVHHPNDLAHAEPNPHLVPAAPRIEAPRLAALLLNTHAITPKAFGVSSTSMHVLILRSSSLSFPLDECLDVLENCPLLKYLDVTLNTQDQVNIAPPRPRISLPNLQKMYIYCCNLLDSPSLLDSLHVPQLRVLRILQSQIAGRTCEEFWAAFDALLAHSRPPLYELCLTVPSTARVILPVLRKLQNLAILDFQVYPPSPDTLAALTPTPNGPWLCPRLSAIYLVNVVCPLWGKGLIDLVKARMPAGGGVWDGESQPEVFQMNTSDDEVMHTQVVKGNYLTELGVWNTDDIGLEEEEQLLELGENSGEKTKFTVQRYKQLEELDPMVPIVSGAQFRAGHAAPGW